MIIQIRTGTLTAEQQAREDLYYQAVKILKAAGMRVEYVKTYTNASDYNPGYISFKK